MALYNGVTCEISLHNVQVKNLTFPSIYNNKAVVQSVSMEFGILTDLLEGIVSLVNAGYKPLASLNTENRIDYLLEISNNVTQLLSVVTSEAVRNLQEQDTKFILKDRHGRELY